MDKSQPFFDPYNFSNVQQFQQPQTSTVPTTNAIQPDMDMMQGVLNPAMYYEQQYMYYKYLTQMLEYKIKLKEFEKLNRETASSSKGT